LPALRPGAASGRSLEAADISVVILLAQVINGDPK